MMKHSNEISGTRNPNLSLVDDIEDLKEIHLAIKEWEEISFCENLDDDMQRNENPPPLCKTWKRRIE